MLAIRGLGFVCSKSNNNMLGKLMPIKCSSIYMQKPFHTNWRFSYIQNGHIREL